MASATRAHVDRRSRRRRGAGRESADDREVRSVAPGGDAMKVFLTGGTGAIGPATVRGLREKGHEVRAVARTNEKAAQLRAQGAEPVTVDLFDGDAVKAAVDGCAAVLHLATNVPPLRRMASKKGWATHNRLRTEATERLIDAALTTGATTFVKESVSFVYPDGSDAWIDETTPPDESIEMLQPTLEGERITRRDYLDAFSTAFGVAKLRPMPTWLVKLTSGSAAAAVIRSWRVSNKKFRDATSWAPRYPSVREGWPAVAREREASRA